MPHTSAVKSQINEMRCDGEALTNGSSCLAFFMSLTTFRFIPIVILYQVRSKGKIKPLGISRQMQITINALAARFVFSEAFLIGPLLGSAEI